jgi:nucleoside-diphosphate-sugar epimerase
MRVLVTGATGFVGSHVADRLFACPDVELRLMVRRSSKLAYLDGVEYERVEGDMRDAESLQAAVKGAEAVVHVAGATSALNEAAYQEVNALGTAMLAEASRQAEVQRLVYVSSQAAQGPGDGTGPPRPVTDYGRSKLAGEYSVLAMRDSMRVAVVRPPVVYGQRDRALLPFYRMAKLGFVPVYGDGQNRLSWVHALDAAAAIAGVTIGDYPTGAVYSICDGEVHTWVSLVRAFGEAIGRQPRVIQVPPALFTAAGYAGGMLQIFSRRPLPLGPDEVRQMRPEAWLCDHEAITRDLGWKPTIAVAEGFRQAVAWYKEQGWL